MAIDQTKLRWNGWGLAARRDPVETREEVWNWLADELGMPSLLATPARPFEEIAVPVTRLAREERDGLTTILGADRVHDDDYTRACHARGRSYHDLVRLRAGDMSVVPDVVACPRGTDEVLAVLMLAEARGIAIVPYGGGTSVVGGVSAHAGTCKAVITLDLSGMQRIIAVDRASRLATVEAGITGPALEQALAAEGTTLGHYPNSFEFSTLGGWISHPSAGQQSQRYGGAHSWLAHAKLVTPRGVLTTENFPTAAGPLLRDLVIGAEGTFGVITEATVRLHTAPSARSYQAFLFRDFQSGIAAVREAMQGDIPPAMLRLSDPDETRFAHNLSRLGTRSGLGDWASEHRLKLRGFGDNACLLVAGFEGDAKAVTFGQKRFTALAKEMGAASLGSKAGARWYDARFRGPYLHDPMLDRGIGVDTLETATSWTKLDQLHHAIREVLEKAIRDTAPRPGAHGFVMSHIAHANAAGASVNVTYIFPRALDREIAQWQTIKHAVSDAILANGGAVSHHYGVGEDHLPWAAAEKSKLGLDVLRAVKNTLDPKGILNPGKLLPG